MSEYVLRALLLCTLGSATLAIGGEIQSRVRDLHIPQTVLDKATLGVDPVHSNLFGQSDPGMKDQIFESTRYVDGRVVLNDFIGKAVPDIRCESIFSSKAESITNFNSYLEHESEAVSFNVGAGFSLGFNSGLSVGASVGFGQRNSEENTKLLEFFQKTHGEVIQSSSRCQTHVVSLNMNVKGVFTKAFIASLRKLNVAAKNPQSEASKIVFRDFVADFGTYYQDETIFGAQVIYESRFSTKAAGEVEKNKRLDCVSSSFSTSLGGGYSLFQIEQTFATESEKCGFNSSDEQTLTNLGIASVRISSVGTIPDTSNIAWAEKASENPVPVKYRLEKISSLFLTDWFPSVFESDQPDENSADTINGTAMYEFFEALSAEYCEIMMGMSCEVISKGCGYNSNCTLGEKCFPEESLEGFKCEKGCGITDNCGTYEKCFNNSYSLSGFDCKKGCQYTANCPSDMICKDDSSERGYSCMRKCEINGICPQNHQCHEEPNSAKGYICVIYNYGMTLIAGGNTKPPSSGRYRDLSKKTESIKTSKSYTNLYRGVYLNALAYSNGRLYMCGGRQNDWKGSIYYTYDCYRFSTSPPFSGRQRISDLPTRAFFTSAVSVGSSSVWFIVENKVHSLNTNNDRFSTVTLPFTAYRGHCAVSNGSHAYVIGAGNSRREIWVNKDEYSVKAWQRVSYLPEYRDWHACLWYDSNIMITGGYPNKRDVEVFNTGTKKIWKGVPLPKDRVGHRMMIDDGKPTVVGGISGSYYLRDIVTFDLENKKWSTISRKLSETKEGFALVQY